MSAQPANQNPGSDQQRVAIAPGNVFNFLGRYKFLIAAAIVAGAALGGVVAFLQQPLYRSEVVVQPIEQSPSTGLTALAGLGGLTGALGINTDSFHGRQNVLAILESRGFNQDFIQKYNLMPRLFSEQWDAQRKQWRDDEDDPPTIRDAFRLFDEEVRTILEDRERGLITIRVDWYDRELASEWANLLVQEADEMVRAREISEAKKNLEFLRRQLDKTPEIEVRQSIYELMEAEIKRQMVAQSREYFVLRLIDPATVEDEDAYISPNHALAVVIGGTLGLLLAFGVALIHANR